MGQAVVHFQIGAIDDQAAVRFYTQLFGWTATPVPDMPYHSVLTESPLGIAGGIAKVDHENEAVVSIFIEVEHVEEILGQAENLGAKVIMSATPVMPGLTLGMFLDPQGRTIGLVHDARPRPQAVAEPAMKKEPAKKAAKKKAPMKPAKAAKKSKSGGAKKNKKNKKNKKK